MISFFIIFSPLVLADTILDGGIRYDIQVKNGLSYADKDNISNNRLDKSYNENKKLLIKVKVDLNDRILAKFSDNSYAVIYKTDLTKIYYYSEFGRLTHYEIKTSLNYPIKSYKYDINGDLVSEVIRPSENESYMYNSKHILIAHWLNNKCFDSNGKIIMMRKIQ